MVLLKSCSKAFKPMERRNRNLYQSVIIDGIVHDIDVCLRYNAPAAAVILMYCAIDAMAFLSMPEGQEAVTRADFIAWAERYMRTDEDQPYQYSAIDLYGARCGIAHTYGAESRLSRNNECRKLVYIIGGSGHHYNPEIDPNTAVLEVNRLIRDFYGAVESFLADVEADENLKPRVDTRLPNLFSVRR